MKRINSALKRVQPAARPRFACLEEIVAEAARNIRAPLHIGLEELATGRRPPDPPPPYEPPHTWRDCLDSPFLRERWASYVADLEEIDDLFHCIPDGWEPAFCDALEDRLGLRSKIYINCQRRDVTPEEMDAIGARAAHMLISWMCWGGDPDARQPWRTICEARQSLYAMHRLEAGALERGDTGRLLKAGDGVTKAFWRAPAKRSKRTTFRKRWRI